MLRYILITLFLFPLLLAAQENAGFDKAFSEYENGNYELAIEMFDAIEKSEGKNPEFFLIRGICFSEAGNDVKAIVDYNRALDLDSEYAEAYNMRGFSFFSQGNSFLAIKDFDKAVSLDPDLVEVYMNRGSAKYDDGDLKGACEDWKTAKRKGLGIAQQLIEQLCE